MPHKNAEIKNPCYFTSKDISQHNAETDCWVSVNGQVLDLSPLLIQEKGNSLVLPILANAGQDISHWFDVNGNVKTFIDPESNLKAAYTPQGPFLHAQESVSSSSVDTPWWKDAKYQVGQLTKLSRSLKIVNTLTAHEEHVLLVCTEESLEQIRERYIREFNSHASGYTWKHLGKNLDLKKTLQDNGIKDSDIRDLAQAGMDQEEWMPTIHLYFNDDLSV